MTDNLQFVFRISDDLNDFDINMEMKRNLLIFIN
jgi:hypothetical protein